MILPYAYPLIPWRVLGGGAVSYERGTAHLRQSLRRRATRLGIRIEGGRGGGGHTVVGGRTSERVWGGGAPQRDSVHRRLCVKKCRKLSSTFKNNDFVPGCGLFGGE